VHRLVIPGEVFSPQGTDHGVDRHGRPFHRERRGAPNVTCTAGTSCAFPANLLQTSSLFFGIQSEERGTATIRTADSEVSSLAANPFDRAGLLPPPRSRGRAVDATASGLTDGPVERDHRRTELAETRRVGDDERRRDVKDFQETCCT
jgi:hypothetical protein